MKRVYSGSKIACVLLLVLVVMFSCKDIKSNKVKSTLENKETGFSDSISVQGPDSDNFILDNTSAQDNGPVYMYCEKMPEFPGGEAAFNDYLRTSIIYPELAVTEKKEGRVVVKFIIKTNGEKSDVQVVRSVRPDIDQECIRVIKGMPVWQPGLINEKLVAVSYYITIRFLLKNSEHLNGIYILPSKNRQ